MKKIIFLLMVVLTLVSCATVEPGHKAVRVEWGGKTDMSEILDEGIHWGVSWLFDDAVQYDVREKTTVKKYEFNDKNNMKVPVEFSLDYRYDPNKVNLFHKNITDIDAKITKTMASAGKEVIPQYSAIELNISKRAEAEARIAEIISREFPEFYLEAIRVQMTDVDIPEKVAELAEETAVQLGRNELAKQKEAEQVALAKAKVAEADGNYQAGILDAKTKKLLSTPDQLDYLRLQVDMEYAKRGVSKYGANNIFGAETAVVRGLKN